MRASMGPHTSREGQPATSGPSPYRHPSNTGSSHRGSSHNGSPHSSRRTSTQPASSSQAPSVRSSNSATPVTIKARKLVTQGNRMWITPERLYLNNDHYLDFGVVSPGRDSSGKSIRIAEPVSALFWLWQNTTSDNQISYIFISKKPADPCPHSLGPLFRDPAKPSRFYPLQNTTNACNGKIVEKLWSHLSRNPIAVIATKNGTVDAEGSTAMDEMWALYTQPGKPGICPRKEESLEGKDKGKGRADR